MKSCGSGAMMRFAPDRAPVRDVVLGVPAGEVDVAHLRGRAAAAPLLAHQPELHARLLQQLGEGARVGGAVEGGLAVDEEDRLAADRDVEPLRPVGARAPGRPGCASSSPSTGSLWRSARRSFQRLPALALVAGRDHQRAHRLDDVDRARAVAVEVAGEQRVRAAQLARAALRAVHVVVGHVLDVDEALLHRDDVRVEGGRRVLLVARDLHHRADLAAELVAGREAAVRVAAPLLDEGLGQPAVAVRVIAVPARVVRPGVRHCDPSSVVTDRTIPGLGERR